MSGHGRKRMKLRQLRNLVLLAAPALAVMATLAGCGKAAEKTLDEAMTLYQDSWFTQAKEAARQHMDDPAGRLVYYLCCVFDSHDQSYAEGLSGLKKLYDDADVRETQPMVWAEAGMSYGRVIQVNSLREQLEGPKGNQVPENYRKEDVRGIFESIVARVPETSQGSTAVIYLAESYFRSGEKSEEDAGFGMVEKYLSSQPEGAQYTVPVHLYIDMQYVNYRGDYGRSYEHLRRAYDLGIVKEMTRRSVMFRMARTCDVKLKKKAEAKAHYEAFLKEYPYAQQTPLVKRYIAELEGK